MPNQTNVSLCRHSKIIITIHLLKHIRHCRRKLLKYTDNELIDTNERKTNY